MAIAQATEKKPDVLPVVVSPAIRRLIAELMAARRQFNRSQLIRDAMTEMADRDLPANWREIVGFTEGEAA